MQARINFEILHARVCMLAFACSRLHVRVCSRSRLFACRARNIRARPVAEGGTWEGQCPSAGTKIEIVPHQTKICSCRFLSYLPKLQMTVPYFKVVMFFLKKKTNNIQDIFVVVLMLIYTWQTSILLWLSSLIARKLIFLCLL